MAIHNIQLTLRYLFQKRKAKSQMEKNSLLQVTRQKRAGIKGNASFQVTPKFYITFRFRNLRFPFNYFTHTQLHNSNSQM